LNLIADFGGGGMLLAVGVLAALVHVRTSGTGQTVDAAMVDGSALLSTSLHGMAAAGIWNDRRSSNLLDGGAPFYAVYQTSDGRHMAVGALETRFFAALIAGLEIESCPPQHERSRWPEMREQFAERFRRHPQSFWADRFSGTEACVAPILTLGEAMDDPHLRARGTFDDVDGINQPQPAPRFSTTPTSIRHGPAQPGRHTVAILSDLGYSDEQISKLVIEGSVA
jgi:alpha-methylacyl-CoA racemase